MFSRNKARRRVFTSSSRFNFERLENRSMLSADFGIGDVCYMDGVEPPKEQLTESNGGSHSFSPPTVVADYQNDFRSPDPTAGWQYLWNGSGQFGDRSQYEDMTWESWRYHPANESFPYLGATFGHPGPGLDDAESGGIERFSIAAYTVTDAGDYSIGNSFLTRAGEFGDGVEVSIHVGSGDVTTLVQVAPESTETFDTDLGSLSAGDTIYVGVGPDGPGAGSGIGNDGYSWDFSILRSGEVQPDQITATIDLDTQRYVGDVSDLDREKYFTFHSSGGGSDQQIQDFMEQYDVHTGRQFWGPLPYARNQTGEVGVYPDITPSTDQSVRPVTQMVQTSHPRDAIRWNTDVQAAADWVTTYYTTVVDSVPEFFEPMNEPFVHAGDSQFSDAPSTDAMRQKMAELYAAIGEAVDNTPALADLKVVGYASAWPSVELWDFGHWDSRMKMFMDVAGDHMDAFSTHLYDGVNVTGQNNRRSGSNSEAILDLIETYSYAKWGFVKPHAITEYGGIEQGYGETYSDIRSAQSLRSINHILFNLLERENDIDISIPFIGDKATWFLDPENNCEPYGSVLWRPDNPDLSDCSGSFTYTWRVHFFDLWKDVDGRRGRIQTSDPDVQAQLFVDGSTAYVAVNNLSDNTAAIDLEFVSGLAGLQNVEIRTMEIPISDSLEPSYTESTQSSAPESVTLETGGTAVLVYNFDSPIEFSNTIRSSKYYTSQHLQQITADQPISFSFHDVQTSTAGDSTLRMAIGRKHNMSKAPEVKVNGTVVDVPNDWAGYDQGNRDDFFGVIEIPVPIALLATSNEVEVTFPDSGGRISSMILDVEAIDIAPEVTGIAINDGNSDRSSVDSLTINFNGLVDFGPDAFSVVQRSDLAGATGTLVNTSFTSQVEGGNTRVTLSFDSLTRNDGGSLIDGNYQLTINASQVAASSNGAQMKSDYLFGDSADESFYSLYGDTDGNRTINVFDLLSFRQAYRSSTGDTNYVSTLDYGGDGSINVFDLLQFRQRYRETLLFV